MRKEGNSLQLLLGISLPKNNAAKYNQKFTWVFMLFLVDFNQIWISWQGFSEETPNENVPSGSCIPSEQSGREKV
jgi:hypothetical protein